MNKVFCKVWSHALKQVVVASEIATCKRSGTQRQLNVVRSNGRMAPMVLSVLFALGGLGSGGNVAA